MYLLTVSNESFSRLVVYIKHLTMSADFGVVNYRVYRIFTFRSLCIRGLTSPSRRNPCSSWPMASVNDNTQVFTKRSQINLFIIQFVKLRCPCVHNECHEFFVLLNSVLFLRVFLCFLFYSIIIECGFNLTKCINMKLRYKHVYFPM